MEIKGLKNSKTYVNLVRAYAGECMARTRYKFIEYGARKEGYKNIADMINDIVYQEFNHARMMYTFIQCACNCTIENAELNAGFPFRERWNLAENLKLAAEDEREEAQIVYPEFEKIACEEGFKDIAGMFKNIIQVETCHMKTFLDLHTQLTEGTLYKKPNPVKWKCMDCGYEAVSDTAFVECPLCQAKQGSIKLIMNDEN